MGLDPGYEVSAIVAWDGTSIIRRQTLPNEELLNALRTGGYGDGYVLAIEQIEAMGMAVGKTVFETVYWSGRFAEAFYPGRAERVPRSAIKLHHCHQRRANDAEIRQAILDRFGPSKEQAIGTTKNRGPLYGLVKHEWAAFAVALTFHDQHADDLRPGLRAEF
jgi:hypothetical protein